MAITPFIFTRLSYNKMWVKKSPHIKKISANLINTIFRVSKLIRGLIFGGRL